MKYLRIIILSFLTPMFSACDQPVQDGLPMTDPMSLQASLVDLSEQQLNQKALSRAEHTIHRIQVDALPASLKTRAYIATAQLKIAHHQEAEATATLSLAATTAENDHSTASKNLYKLLAKTAFDTGDRLKGTFWASKLSLCADTAPEDLLYHLILPLMHTPIQTLQSMWQHSTDRTQQGWIALMLVAKQANASSDISPYISHWKTLYPNHPANRLLNMAGSPHDFPSAPIKNVTLLLPLSGPYHQQGQTVYHGILSAYYQSAQFRPHLYICDTYQFGSTGCYQQAVQHGSDLVIGPLLKQNLARLIDTSTLPIPTIALNHASVPNTPSHLIEFGLFPEQEAEQIAAEMTNTHIHKALLIRPDTPRGQRIAQAFSTAFTRNNGVVVATGVYASPSSLASTLRETLKIKHSHQRALRIQQLLHTTMRYKERPRKDFDAIFLVASAKAGQQIVPLLRYYFIHHTAIYATSDIITQPLLPRARKDLVGIVYPDAPLLQSHSHSTTTVDAPAAPALPITSRPYPKLYALGMDAFSLAPSINTLKQLPYFPIPHATGALYLPANQTIHRVFHFFAVTPSKIIEQRPS